MKEYIIRCNEEQLKLLASAVELQMRVRIGQGWSILDNVINFSESDYRECHEYYCKLLDDILERIVYGNSIESNRLTSKTKMIERDMWKSLLMRKDENDIPLGKYGFMKVEEVNE